MTSWNFGDWVCVASTGQCVVALIRGDNLWAIGLAFVTSLALLPRSHR